MRGEMKGKCLLRVDPEKGGGIYTKERAVKEKENQRKFTIMWRIILKS